MLGVAIDREAPDGPTTDLCIVMQRMDTDVEKLIAQTVGMGLRVTVAGAGVGAGAPGSQGPALSIPHRLALLRQTAMGLRFLHARNMVHGDLKPANVLVNSSGSLVRLSDFGVSRIRSAADTSSFPTAGAAGTKRYRDPAVSTVAGGKCCARPRTCSPLAFWPGRC